LSTWAIVPVKARSSGKQRLAAALPAQTRTILIRTMLEHVLSVLQGTAGIEQVLILSPDRERLPAAVRVLADAGGGLNAALEAAMPELLAQGATRALIVFADLPLLTPEDVAALIGAAGTADVALAPDHTGTGTNALSLALPTSFRFQFGPGSRARHLAEATRTALTAVAIERPGLAFDLDDPADLQQLRSRAHPRYGFLG
jgi:2-phospho-L-lactate/phosphoenolpyruvate guanylyltransferase